MNGVTLQLNILEKEGTIWQKIKIQCISIEGAVSDITQMYFAKSDFLNQIKTPLS